MRLYYAKGACSLAVHLLLNYLEIEHEAQSVNLSTKKTESGEDFFAINPKGAVPTLVLDDGTVLTENAVIQQYLVDTYDKNHNLLAPVGNINRYLALIWLNYAATELHKGAAPLFNSSLEAVVKKNLFIPAFEKKLDYINRQLEKRKYILGDKLTIGDFYIFTVLRWCPHLGIAIEQFSNINHYINSIKELPAVRKTLEQEGL